MVAEFDIPNDYSFKTNIAMAKAIGSLEGLPYGFKTMKPKKKRSKAERNKRKMQLKSKRA